jgi:hypothetical protein
MRSATRVGRDAACRRCGRALVVDGAPLPFVRAPDAKLYHAHCFAADDDEPGGGAQPAAAPPPPPAAKGKAAR